MNQAATSRLSTAIRRDDLDGVHLALQQGADPNGMDGKEPPASVWAKQAAGLPHGLDILNAMLSHGLNPNLKLVDPQRSLLMELVNGPREDAPLWDVTASDAMALRLIESGAEVGPTLMERATSRHRGAVLKVCAERNVFDGRFRHPMEMVFGDRTLKLSSIRKSNVIALLSWWHDVDPTWVRHRYENQSVVERWIWNREADESVLLWALAHGVTDGWTTTEERQKGAARIWEAALKLALSDERAVNHPVWQATWNDPILRAEIGRANKPLDVTPDDKPITLMDHLFDVRCWSRDGIRFETWQALQKALEDEGVQRAKDGETIAESWSWLWSHLASSSQGVESEQIKAWVRARPDVVAPHPVTGRTGLFGALTEVDADQWVELGCALNHVDAQGHQAFTHLVRVVAQNERATDLARWCEKQWRLGRAPLTGWAHGRPLEAWVAGRQGLSKAWAKAVAKASSISTKTVEKAVISLDSPHAWRLHVYADQGKWSTLAQHLARHKPSIEVLETLDEHGRSLWSKVLLIDKPLARDQAKGHQAVIGFLLEAGVDMLREVNVVMLESDIHLFTSSFNQKFHQGVDQAIANAVRFRSTAAFGQPKMALRGSPLLLWSAFRGALNRLTTLQDQTSYVLSHCAAVLMRQGRFSAVWTPHLNTMWCAELLLLPPAATNDGIGPTQDSVWAQARCNDWPERWRADLCETLFIASRWLAVHSIIGACHRSLLLNDRGIEHLSALMERFTVDRPGWWNASDEQGRPLWQRVGGFEHALSPNDRLSRHLKTEGVDWVRIEHERGLLQAHAVPPIAEADDVRLPRATRL